MVVSPVGGVELQLLLLVVDWEDLRTLRETLTLTLAVTRGTVRPLHKGRELPELPRAVEQGHGQEVVGLQRERILPGPGECEGAGVEDQISLGHVAGTVLRIADHQAPGLRHVDSLRHVVLLQEGEGQGLQEGGGVLLGPAHLPGAADGDPQVLALLDRPVRQLRVEFYQVLASRLVLGRDDAEGVPLLGHVGHGAPHVTVDAAFLLSHEGGGLIHRGVDGVHGGAAHGLHPGRSLLSDVHDAAADHLTQDTQPSHTTPPHLLWFPLSRRLLPLWRSSQRLQLFISFENISVEFSSKLGPMCSGEIRDFR